MNTDMERRATSGPVLTWGWKEGEQDSRLCVASSRREAVRMGRQAHRPAHFSRNRR